MEKKMNAKCIICGSNISIQKNRNYCIKCWASYDSQMRFIPERHNWNLEDYSKNFLKDPESSCSKRQN